VKRYSVKEAAQVLGVGTDAIRKRVQRNTIQHERVDGTVYVWLDDDEPRHDLGVTEDIIEAYKDQLEAYRDQVEHLRRELEVRNEELRRKDTIMMTMAQRIPELEPARETPPELREEPETITEEPEGVEIPLGEERRPWWQRWFGG